MKNRIFKTLFLFVFGLSMLQAQSITAEFDETEIFDWKWRIEMDMKNLDDSAENTGFLRKRRLKGRR